MELVKEELLVMLTLSCTLFYRVNLWQLFLNTMIVQKVFVEESSVCQNYKL